MKPYSLLLKLTVKSLASAALLLAFNSCSMMEEDRTDCPTGLYVNFKYDYNIQRADMFTDHVGGVSVYVFDEDNHLIMRKDVANAEDGSSMPLRNHDYQMHFTQEELPEGNYRLYAMAFQKDYDRALQTEGAKYRRTELNKGDEIEKLAVSLDYQTSGDGTTAEVVHESQPLDTLWMTLPGNEHRVTLKKDCPTYETIGLIRDTKQLNLTLRQTVDPTDMSDDMYDVKIIDKNGKLLYDNSTDPATPTLTYTPWARWTSQMSTGSAAASVSPQAEGDTDNENSDETGTETPANIIKTAHYELDFNRLVMENAAKLLVTKKETGETIIDINLPAMLANGRNAYENTNYSSQEYLDRENEFHLDFFLSGNKWQYVSVRIDVLGWAVRIQNVEL